MMEVSWWRTTFGQDEKQRIGAAIDGEHISQGSVTAAFEQALGAYLGVPYVVATTSGSMALLMALMALGVGPGDEVIVPNRTWIATAHAPLVLGAKVRLVDVLPDLPLMDVAQVEAAITPRTKAVIPVHLYGTMCDMPALKAVADRHGLAIVEDCAHCIEGERSGVRPGQLSDAACYSFYATKNLACGEGGAVATRSEELARQVKLLSLHGMSKNAAGRYHGSYQHWDMLTLGWKCNLDDIHSALIVDQLSRLDALWARRREIYERYEAGFSGTPGLGRPAVVGKSAHHLYTIWVDPARRDQILHDLQERGVGVAVNFRAIHLLSYFSETFGFKRGDFPRAEAIGDRTISLPFYPKLSDAEVDYVIAQVLEVVQG